MEQQQPQASALTPVPSGPAPAGPPTPTPIGATAPDRTATGTDPGKDPWPAVPPAPAPVKPAPPPAAPEPPILSGPLSGPPPPIRFPSASVPPPPAAALEEDPTLTIAGPPSTTSDPVQATAGPEPGSNPGPERGAVWTEERRDEGAERRGKTVPLARRARASEASATGTEGTDSPLLELQRTVRRQQAAARQPGRDVVWQPRFAYSSALIILLALTVVSMPLWIVLYRITDAATGGPPVADLVALCMMLLGGFLTGAAAWVIIIEMRGRVRMVDTLARTGEREAMIAPAAPELPVLDAPLAVPSDPLASPPVWDPDAVAATHQARVEAQQVNAAAMLEASSKLLSAFSNVLRSFGQLPAQVAMLAVALALFVGATVLSLR